MNVKKEIIDNSIDSPRLKLLGDYIEKWMGEYQKTKGESIDLVILGYDKEYKHNIKFSLTSKDNAQHDIFNGIFQYVSNLIVEYPEIEQLFNENIKRMKEHKNELERENN